MRKYLLIVTIIISGCNASNNEIVSGVLVSNEWLQEKLSDPDLVIMHVGTWEVFDSIHIPGSRYVDPYDFTVTTGDLSNELPELAVIAEELRSVGVNMDSRILLYYEDEGLITRSARVFMTLDYAGLGDQTFVLNGGLPGWVEEGGKVNHSPADRGLRPLTGVATEVTEGDLKLGATREVVMLAPELNQLRWDPDYVIVDSRSQEEYYGTLDSTGLIATGGHIEGAYFMDYETLISESTPYRFSDDADLLKDFEKTGMDPKKTAVFYCGSGVRASVSYMVARHLGYPALLYDGSYQEWEELDLPLTSPAIDLSDND